MLRRTATVAIAAALGSGAAIGVAACGEDREGDVKFEDATTSETAPGPMPGAPTTPATETTPTGGEFLPETGTETSP
jgi:hypothetical protein